MVVAGEALCVVDRRLGHAAGRQRSGEMHVGRRKRRQLGPRLPHLAAVHPQSGHDRARPRCVALHHRRHAVAVAGQRRERQIGRRRRHQRHRHVHAVGHAERIAAGEPLLLQVGDEHDASARRAERVHGGTEGRRVARASGARTQRLEERTRLAAVGRWGQAELSAVVEGHDADQIGHWRCVHGRQGRSRRRAPGLWRRHAHRRVDRHHRDRRLHRVGAPHYVGTCERHCQQRHSGDAQRQQQQVAQRAPLALLHRRLRQHLHRGEVDHRVATPAEQMQEDRDAHSEGAGQERGSEEAQAEHVSSARAYSGRP